MNFLNIEKKLNELEKQFFLISRFMLFSTLKKNTETPPSIRPSRFVYWLNGRWFLQIVDWDSLNLYPLYPLFPCSDFVSQMWGWFFLGGGGGCVFFAFHAISNIKKKFGVKKNSVGVGVLNFFLEKQFFLISRFMLFSTLQKY